MVLCCLFLVSVSVTVHLMFVKIVRFRLLRGHYLGKSCSLGWPYVLFAFCLFVIVISRFGFDDGSWVLIDPVPGHCLLVSFTHHFQ